MIKTRSTTLAPDDARQNEFFDGRFHGEGGDVLVEIKSTSTLRDVRGALTGLLYALEQQAKGQPAACAVLALTQSRLAPSRLSAELEQFRAIARPDLGARIFAAVLDADGRPAGELPSAAGAGLVDFIRQLAQQEAAIAAPAQRVSRQAVKSLMLESYVAQAGQVSVHAHVDIKPANVVSLMRATGASHPTVASAIKELDAQHALAQATGGAGRAGRSVQLLTPGPDLWRRIGEGHAAERRIQRYVDPTGQALSPEKMMLRLEKIRRARMATGRRDLALDVAIGGVLGAKMMYPELDLTGAMRLDLCVYGCGADYVAEFMRELDAGLVLTEDPKAMAVVVIHETWDIAMKARIGASPQLSPGVPLVMTTGFYPALRPASAVDCYADLLEQGYEAEARDFAVALSRRGAWTRN